MSMKLAEINQKIKMIKAEKFDKPPSLENWNTDPFEQFLLWFDLALEDCSSDPSAMVLATVDEQGFPDTRLVLLKELEYHRFIFYTSYESKKARDLAHQNIAALNFYWPPLCYQVRIRGRVEKLDRKKNESYFATRPRGSQLSAHAWIQSSSLASEAELEERIKKQDEYYANQTIPCPQNWGGYALSPFEYEFFQRKPWRRHERLLYTLDQKNWKKIYLAP